MQSHQKVQSPPEYRAFILFGDPGTPIECLKEVVLLLQSSRRRIDRRQTWGSYAPHSHRYLGSSLHRLPHFLERK